MVYKCFVSVEKVKLNCRFLGRLRNIFESDCKIKGYDILHLKLSPRVLII